MTSYDRKTGRKTSWVTKPKPYKSERVWISRRVGKYRVGKSVPIEWAIFLTGGPIIKLIYVGLLAYGIWLVCGS